MTITCLNCAGKGWVSVFSWDGKKYPKLCEPCHGTGNQKVRGT